jgi:thiamine biosynthesis lipoprotein
MKSLSLPPVLRPPCAELRRARPLLGTLVEITAGGASAARLERAVARAFAAIEVVQARLSFHDPASDLARLNQAVPGEWVTVHPLSVAVLRHARALARASEGRFDAAVAPRLQSWGLLPRTCPTGRRPVAARGSAGLEFAAGGRLRLPGPMILDLGGLAKGYAVDRAVAVLRRAGVTRGLVNAGGDLRVLGEWTAPVQVRHPGQPGVFFALGGVRDGALATSALTYSARQWRGRVVGALVDPRTGQACGHGVSISVWARSAWLADGLTKVVASAWAEGPGVKEAGGGREPGGAAQACGRVATGGPAEARFSLTRLLARYRARAVVVAADGQAEWLGAEAEPFLKQSHVA